MKMLVTPINCLYLRDGINDYVTRKDPWTLGVNKIVLVTRWDWDLVSLPWC